MIVKNMIIIRLLLFFLTFKALCESKQHAKRKKLLPYFRSQIEVTEGSLLESAERQDSNVNIVSLLVNNAKEIFSIDIDTNEIITLKPITSVPPTQSAYIPIITIPTRTSATISTNSIDFIINEIYLTNSSPIFTTRIDQKLYENFTFHTLLDDNVINGKGSAQSKDLESRAISPKKLVVAQRALKANTTYGDSDSRRSCVMCNNVDIGDCNDPKKKLIQSAMCENEEDLCYSMHTPFGIVDRGCFNPNHNFTMYVCASNLCNFIPSSEMPYIFDSKHEWVNDVIEISRKRHFRKSIFKGMSCLKCEITTTGQQGDIIEGNNCVQGIVGELAVEECKVDEVCGIRVLKASGYIWRGCVKAPLYNYWWELCDYDLCNIDPIVSLYDMI